MLVPDLTGHNHIALITGATGGIGTATCHALARLGYSAIAVHYHKAQQDAEELVKALEDSENGEKNVTVRAAAFQADLSKYDEVRRLHGEVISRLGHPTILFNNAGTSLGKSGITSLSPSEISIEDFEETWRANCGSAFLLTQLCVSAMVERGWGRVVFCSSVAGFTGGVVGPHYASSKSALHGLIHWMASAYAKKGVTVNGVAPAMIERTKMLPGGQNRDGDLVKKIPVGFLGTPEEVAETVVWMIKTGYVTDKVVGVDGGMFVQ